MSWADAEASRLHRPLAGIAFCLVALLAFAVQDSIVKSLSARYPVLQVLGLRSILVLIVLILVGLYVHGTGILKTSQPKPMLVRGALAFLAFTTYYLALSRIPLADAAAVYMTAPLFVTMLSALLLGESVGWHRWMAVLVGFAAVLVMLNPGSSLFRIEAAMPLFSALCYAMIPILNRKIGLSERVLTMAIYTTAAFLVLCMTASVLVHALPPTIAGEGFTATVLRRWSWPTAGDLLLIALSGAVFTIALLCITQAYRIAIVSTVAPFEYSYLVWASLLGFLVFGDVPAARTVIGSSAVVVCGCYILYRERMRYRVKPLKTRTS